MTENDGEIDMNDNKYCKNYLNYTFKLKYLLLLVVIITH